ncbi:sec-independent translocase [Propionibacteriaceae bacterium Y2011]|uniref:sec-independent translocase n=1 Tax=Microlunatus sp. Y2014 TaxID=3418488 RepID=UPI003B47D16D
MFDVGGFEILALIVLAIVVFGPERLPEFARKAAQLLHYVRGLASQAQEQLGEELGPEFKNMDFRDLNPKQFVKKHLLDEVEPIVADVKNELNSGKDAIKNATSGIDKDFDLKNVSDGGPTPVAANGALVPAGMRCAPWDPEAT